MSEKTKVAAASLPRAGALSGADRVDRAIVSGVWALIGGALIFFAFPWIDLAVSDLFFTPTLGFSVGQSWPGRAARTMFITLTDGTILATLAMLVGSFFLLKLRNLPRREMAFGILTYLIIPGVLVNAIIKPIWAARARSKSPNLAALCDLLLLLSCQISVMVPAALFPAKRVRCLRWQPCSSCWSCPACQFPLGCPPLP